MGPSPSAMGGSQGPPAQNGSSRREGRSSRDTHRGEVDVGGLSAVPTVPPGEKAVRKALGGGHARTNPRAPEASTVSSAGSARRQAGLRGGASTHVAQLEGSLPPRMRKDTSAGHSHVSLAFQLIPQTSFALIPMSQQSFPYYLASSLPDR